MIHAMGQVRSMFAVAPISPPIDIVERSTLIVAGKQQSKSSQPESISPAKNKKENSRFMNGVFSVAKVDNSVA
jgi:hypothetical protein